MKLMKIRNNPPHSKENKEHIEIYLKDKRELCLALTPSVFRLVRTCSTTNKIWQKLKEIYGGNEKQLKSQQTTILSEFGLFKQNLTKLWNKFSKESINC